MYWEPIFAVAGAVAGWAGSRVLGRARNPAVVSTRWCALGTALLWFVVAMRWVAGGIPGWWLPVPLVLTALGVPLVLADLRYRRLPDALTLPAYPLAGLAVGIAAVAGPGGALAARAALAGAVFVCLHVLVHAVAPAALGAGDVKLSGSLGVVLGATGWPALLIAACAGAAITLVLAGFAAALRLGRWRGAVPHGPGLLAASCAIAVFPGAGLGVGMGS